MTTQGKSLENLGRRAVACKHWRWMPGMMLQWKTENGSQYRGRVCDTWSFEDEGELYCEGHEDRFTRDELKAARPDLSDPATLGCLLHLVREAWPDEWHEFMVPIFDGFSHWRVGCLDLQRLPGAPKLIVPVDLDTMKPLVWAYSEAEALVVALEAAP